MPSEPVIRYVNWELDYVCGPDQDPFLVPNPDGLVCAYADLERVTRERDEALQRAAQADRCVDAAGDEIERLHSALTDLLAAFEHEAAQGDGIAEEHEATWNAARVALDPGPMACVCLGWAGNLGSAGKHHPQCTWGRRAVVAFRMQLIGEEEAPDAE